MALEKRRHDVEEILRFGFLLRLWLAFKRSPA